MVTGTPREPKPINPECKYYTWNANESHKQTFYRIKVDLK